MNRLPQRTRLIISIVIFLCFLLLAYALADIVYPFTALLPFAGAAIFVYLNPELMRGE